VVLKAAKYKIQKPSTCQATLFRCKFWPKVLTLLLVCHQTHNLSRNKIACTLAKQLISVLHLLNPQQMLIMQGEKCKTSTKTCDETMLLDKLRVFVSRILLSLAFDL